MSLSSCSGRVALHLQPRLGQAVLSWTPRHLASALSQGLPTPDACSLQHGVSDRPSYLASNRQYSYISGLASRWSSLTSRCLSARSSVHDARGQANSCSHGCNYSTRAEDRPVRGPTFMETFAGIGGFGVAATKLGFVCVYANENNSHCIKTYEKNHCRGGPGISNVDDRDIETVTSTMSHPSRTLPIATIAFGGFPCRPFSILGKREGLDDEEDGHLIFEFMKLLIHLRNPIVVLENVSPFQKDPKLEGLKVVREEFEAAGYHMSSHIYESVDFNLAQNRPRCFIVAVRKDLAAGPFDFKNPPSRRPDLALTDFLDPTSPVEDPSLYMPSNGVWVPKRIMNGTQAKIDWKHTTVERVKGYKGLKRIGKWKNEDPKEPFNYGNIVYHHTGLASCICTREGNWYQVPGSDGTDIVRQLSLREKLRLQGFPESFEVPVSPSQARKQVGNSVPPPMAGWILRCLQEQFPDIFTSAHHTTTEVWPQVQARHRSQEEKDDVRRQQENLYKRKAKGEARRKAREAVIDQEASGSEDARTGLAIGSGESLAMRKKRLNELNELNEHIKALEKVLHL